MKITNYQKNTYDLTSFQSQKTNKKAFLKKQETTDVFYKSAPSIQGCSETNTKISKKELEEVYSEVFEKFLVHMPITKTLKIDKPNIKFEKNCNAQASYDFMSNTIEISTNFQDDMFAYEACNKSGELMGGGVIFKSTKDNFMQSKDDSRRLNFNRLNPDEKKLYLKAVIAHELRHWAQEHIVACTQGCQDVHNHKLESVNRLIKTFEEICETTKTLLYFLNGKHKKYKQELKESKEKYQYILNFKPKHILPEDYKIPTSIASWNKNYWSIKEHFYPAIIKYRNSNVEEYKINPTEIDAYYYEEEFMIEEKIKNKTPNIRDRIFSLMLIPCTQKGAMALEDIEKNGYPPLITN